MRSVAAVLRKLWQQVVEDDTGRALHRFAVFVLAEVVGGSLQHGADFGVRQQVLSASARSSEITMALVALPTSISRPFSYITISSWA
jgi:hypothetical protein